MEDHPLGRKKKRNTLHRTQFPTVKRGVSGISGIWQMELTTRKRKCSSYEWTSNVSFSERRTHSKKKKSALFFGYRSCLGFRQKISPKYAKMLYNGNNCVTMRNIKIVLRHYVCFSVIGGLFWRIKKLVGMMMMMMMMNPCLSFDTWLISYSTWAHWYLYFYYVILYYPLLFILDIYLIFIIFS